MCWGLGRGEGGDQGRLDFIGGRINFELQMGHMPINSQSLTENPILF